jgi:hypothetical protein
MTHQHEESWYAVRCIFELRALPEGSTHDYEERVTLWTASSLDHAIVQGEAEAHDYAARILDSGDVYLGLAQAYRLTDAPGHGAEVFSLIRTSRLPPDSYLDTFFDTGDEKQQP